VIEKKTAEVIEACKILMKSYDTRILELQTFQRENAPTVHAYLFDTLYETKTSGEEVKTEEQKPLQQLVTVPLIDVFMKYKGVRYSAKFDIGKEKIIYEGKEYAPSTISIKIVGTSRNGWRDWKFIDEQGKEHLIDELRKPSK
jgi:hypothetical protein